MELGNGFKRILNHSPHDIICTADETVRIVQEDINKHTSGKEVIELGCNDGALEDTIDCVKYTGVDLYS